MNKKIILLLLAIVLIFGATSAVSAANIDVSDVADDNSVSVEAVSVANDAANIASVDATSDNNKNISDLSASAKEDDKEINSVGATREVISGDFDELKRTI